MIRPVACGFVTGDPAAILQLFGGVGLWSVIETVDFPCKAATVLSDTIPHSKHCRNPNCRAVVERGDDRRVELVLLSVELGTQ